MHLADYTKEDIVHRVYIITHLYRKNHHMISFYETSLFQHVWILNMRDKGLMKLSHEIHFPRIWVGRGGPRKRGTHLYMRVWLHISVTLYVIS